jgi:hypothetical protein
MSNWSGQQGKNEVESVGWLDARSVESSSSPEPIKGEK